MHNKESFTPFLIVGAQRTGTTFIRTSLSSHPDILCHGEVFKLGKKSHRHEDTFWHYSRLDFSTRARTLLRPALVTADFLDRLYSERRYAAIGFKLMLSQCRRWPYIWPLLKERKVKVILVDRRNTLKTLVSRRAASCSGVYHVSETLGTRSSVRCWSPKKVILELKDLVQDLDSISAEQAEWKSRIGNDLPHLDLVYEDYVADTARGNDAMLDFLNVRHVPLSSDLQKVNPDDLAQIIGNYEDVAAALQGTRYAEHLEM